MSDRVERLNEAFVGFAAASGALGNYYEKLRETVRMLAVELEERNAHLARALAEAETAREYLRCVLESMGDGIVVLDPTGTVAMINRAAGEMLGIDPASAAGLRCSDLGIDPGRTAGAAVLSANGRRYDVILSRSDLVDGHGAPRGSVLLVKDVTRMKELEAHYERNRRLIRMGEMAAKIVHEIRSPLCSIELYAGMLESELAGQGPPDLVRGIASGIRSLNTILTNMLYFARNPMPRLEPIDLSAVLEASVSMLAPAAAARGIALRCEAPEAVRMRGDAELIKQAFLNVLLNAIQACGPGGTVVAQAKAEGPDATAAISDDGPGVPEEDRERIFDPFFSTKEKGTGLGLAIVAKIARAHGGFIRLRVPPGGGTVFEFRFPRGREGAA